VSEVDEIIRRASLLPLLDAAYYLWTAKSELDRHERAPVVRPALDLEFDSKEMRTLVQDIIAHIHHERANAEHGSTF
jgi:hypothetical protein